MASENVFEGGRFCIWDARIFRPCTYLFRQAQARDAYPNFESPQRPVCIMLLIGGVAGGWWDSQREAWRQTRCKTVHCASLSLRDVGLQGWGRAFTEGAALEQSCISTMSSSCNLGCARRLLVFCVTSSRMGELCRSGIKWRLCCCTLFLLLRSGLWRLTEHALSGTRLPALAGYVRIHCHILA